MTYRIFNPARIEENFISKDIILKYDKSNYKILANNPIKKGTVIIKEIPLLDIFGETISKEKNEMFELVIMLDKMVKHYNYEEITELYPRTRINEKDFIKPFQTNPFNINITKIIKNQSNYKNPRYSSNSRYSSNPRNENNIKLEFHKNTSIDIYQECYWKYLFNAFDMYNSPVILPIGAKINHSNTPNIYFYEKNNAMYFETIKNIKTGEEITYSYLRNFDTNKYNMTQEDYLAYHYNFI